MNIRTMAEMSGAKAIMDSLAETQVRVGITADVELERPVEDAFVVVGRAVEQPHALPLFDPHPAEFGVGRRGALEAVHRRGPADDLVDRGGPAGRA